MPRRRIIHFNNAIYHVMLRGNFKQDIFYDPQDHQWFIDRMESVVKKYGCKIHLFCLMTNHIHLVIQVSHIRLGSILRSLKSPFAKKLNKKYDREGHVFSGPALVKIVHDEKYLLELCYYIHYNPIKAFMVDTIDDYSWSSHHAYKWKVESFVTTDKVLDLLRRKIPTESPYKDFIYNRDNFEISFDFCDFDEGGLLTIRDDVKYKMMHAENFSLLTYSLDEICDFVSSKMDIPKRKIKSETKESYVVLARALFTYFANGFADYKFRDIAYYLNRHPSTVSETMYHFLELPEKHSKMKYWIEKLKYEFGVKEIEEQRRPEVEVEE
jgi:putative transposase